MGPELRFKAHVFEPIYVLICIIVHLILNKVKYIFRMLQYETSYIDLCIWSAIKRSHLILSQFYHVHLVVFLFSI